MSVSQSLQNELLKNPKSLTAAQATDLLDLVNTKADLQALIDNLDASTHGNTTVLYSGGISNNLWSTDVINNLKTNDSFRILDNTEAFKF